MSSSARTTLRQAAWVLSPSILLLGAACDPEGGGPQAPIESVGPSKAYGIWSPGPNDTCTREDHDRFSVVGLDGKLYPTWHPPVDPVTSCTFGHEHGRDPSGSALFAEVGPIPFGYANEQLDLYDPNGMRHEDHVGHKIEWENNIELRFGGVAGTLVEVRCDVLTKLHQGSHSKDAFTNNLHELVYHFRCNDRTELHVTVLSAIGTPGQFTRSCDDATIVVGPANPPNSPEGGGERRIPDRTCIEQYLLVPDGETSDFRAGLRESWETSNRIRTADGRTVAFFNPYYQVLHPSRYHDASRPDGLARTIDVCYEVEANGDRARGEPCDASTAGGTIAGLSWDDPRSAFNGALRFVDINYNHVTNAEGPAVWYTDPFGRNGRTEPFAGSIRQFIAVMDNTRPITPSGPAIGRDRDYGGTAVHAPN